MPDRPPPRYQQIAEFLRVLISRAEPGDRLPSESDLCERFGVSRMTARQAIQVVANEGAIERRRGAGTFVRTQPVPRDLGSPLSLTKSILARGMTASSEILGWSEVRPDTVERAELGLGAQDLVYALERLRLADGKPMAVERAVIPRDLALALGDGFQDGSLHDAFRNAGRHPTEAHAEVSARLASKRERELLDLTTSGVIIAERRTIYDQDGAPLERTETRYAADRYVFRAVLRDAGDQS